MQYKHLLVSLVIGILFFSNTKAANFEIFSKDLHYGMKGNSDVIQLQEFLTDQNLYTGPISGNFFSLTLKAVKAFQSAHGIRAAGYFGPLTRTQANILLQKDINDSNDQAAQEVGATPQAIASSPIIIPQEQKISTPQTAQQQSINQSSIQQDSKLQLVGFYYRNNYGPLKYRVETNEPMEFSKTEFLMSPFLESNTTGICDREPNGTINSCSNWNTTEILPITVTAKEINPWSPEAGIMQKSCTGGGEKYCNFKGTLFTYEIILSKSLQDFATPKKGFLNLRIKFVSKYGHVLETDGKGFFNSLGKTEFDFNKIEE